MENQTRICGRIRLTPSRLEAWRKYQSGTSFDPQKDLDIAMGVPVPTSPAMQFGLEFHDALLFQKYTPRMELLREYIEEKRRVINPISVEIPFTLVLPEFPDVEIVGRVDAIKRGRVGVEIKTTQSYSGSEQYSESVQWKLYCMGLGLRRIEYYVFELDENGERHRCYDFWECPYPGMDAEVTELVASLVDFLMQQQKPQEEQKNG